MIEYLKKLIIQFYQKYIKIKVYNIIMSLYAKDDIELLSKNIDSINEKIERKQLEMYEPNDIERKKITTFILDFIKANKRKIYGGYALNNLVIDKSLSEGFYKDYQTPDVDFYSPSPIEDLINLCNILQKAGFKRVVGKESRHSDTYSIFVNFQLYCDISYVPRNIYNRMPFKEIKGLNYIHPFFMTIDYLRMITDPLASYWRIEKSLKRMVLLQKHYPLPKVDKPIQIMNNQQDLEKCVDLVSNYLVDRKSTITIGFYAYNYFVNASETKNKNVKPINIPYHEFISTNYKGDFDELIEILKKQFGDTRITHKEFYPFFQFTGFSVEILLDNEVIAVIYSHNKKCLPYQIVPALEFKDGKINKTKGNITLGSFSLTVLFAQIMTIKYRVNNDRTMTEVYMTIVSHLIQARAEYFKKYNKNIFNEDTLFRDFIVECIGEGIHPDREVGLRMEARRKKNKKAYYMYDPEKDMKSADTTYNFSNVSGNEIKNDKNLQLKEFKITSELDVELDQEPEPEVELPSEEKSSVVPPSD
jgi:hypothetical protein